MSKYITFGKWNSFYKYIVYYIIIRLIQDYLFDTNFPEKIKIIKSNNLPSNILVQSIFNYLATFIFSFILFKFKYMPNKKVEDIKIREISEPENNLSYYINRPSFEVNLIFNNYKKNITISVMPFIFTILLLVLSKQLENNFDNIGLKEIDYWMFELFFYSYFSKIILNVELYLHQIVAIAFIICLSTSLVILSDIFLFKDEEVEKFYKKYLWTTPIIILSFILGDIVKDYFYCKIKWYLDIKYISPLKILIWYGLIGTIICLIFSSISSFFKCEENKSFDYITSICRVNKTNDDNNSTVYYYDSFSIFFNNLWQKDRKLINNIIFLFLFLINISLNFAKYYFSILIIQKLNPIFFLLSISIYYYISETMKHIIIYIIGMKIKKYDSFIILAELFYTLGAIYYLELIKFNFCG